MATIKQKIAVKKCQKMSEMEALRQQGRFLRKQDILRLLVKFPQRVIESKG
jgi:hypothetical protein